VERRNQYNKLLCINYNSERLTNIYIYIYIYIYIVVSRSPPARFTFPSISFTVVRSLREYMVSLHLGQKTSNTEYSKSDISVPFD